MEKKTNKITFLITLSAIINQIATQEIFESDMNFRIEPGATTCFFEKGKAGQMMEAQYQVIDGQHGDLDINFDITDPNGVKLLSDIKKSHNAVIIDLVTDGDYVFCMDNSFSMMNSKLVFVYVLVEDKEQEIIAEEDDEEEKLEEILEWIGYYPNGENYTIEVTQLVDYVTRTLKHVVKARHVLDVYGALKSRDSYLAFEDTWLVDAWSGFQIVFMCVVGFVQVYMIKKLFCNYTS